MTVLELIHKLSEICDGTLVVMDDEHRRIICVGKDGTLEFDREDDDMPYCRGVSE